MKIGSLDVRPVLDGVGHESKGALTRPGVEDPWACHPGQVEAAQLRHMDVQEDEVDRVFPE